MHETFRHPRWYELTSAIMLGGRRRAIYDGLVRLSEAAPGERVLDVGCGSGYFARRLARAVGTSGRIEGIDLSPESIAYATRRGPANAAFTVATAQRLPHDDDAFDVVVSSLALHHIEPDQRPAALAEMRRVLRPGGRLLIVELGGHPGKGLIGRLIGHGAGHDLADEIPGLLAEAGFAIADRGDLPHRMHYVLAREIDDHEPRPAVR